VANHWGREKMSEGIKGKKVLWVDDRFETLRDELRALTEAGALSTCVTTVNAAYEKLLKETYDVVIIDIMLPQGDSLPDDLKQIQRAAGFLPSGEVLGLVLALWLVGRTPNANFFFYTVVPDEGSSDVRHKVDPENRRFVDKADEKTWGSNFAQVVASQL
jgi:hypothetical protein